MNAGLATAAPLPPPGPQMSAAATASPAPTKPAAEGFGAHLAKAIAVKAPAGASDDAKPAARPPEARPERPTRTARADRTETRVEKADAAPAEESAPAQGAPAAGSDAAAQAQMAALAASQTQAQTQAQAQTASAPKPDMTGKDEAVALGDDSKASGPAAFSPDSAVLSAGLEAADGPSSDLASAIPDLQSQSAQSPAAPQAPGGNVQPAAADQAKLARQLAAEQIKAEQAQASQDQASLMQAALDPSAQAAGEEAAATVNTSETAPKTTAKAEPAAAEAKAAKTETGLQPTPSAGAPVTALVSTGRSGGGFSGESADGGRDSEDAASLTGLADLTAGLQSAPAADTTLAPAPAPIHVAPQTLQTAAVVMKAGPQTVATLASQMVSKIEGGATRFDLELHPLDLGRVDVRLEVGAGGQISAAMSFDNPQAAAEMRARSADLQKALENAGFNLSGGLSFDVAGDRGQGGSRNTGGEPGPAQRARALETAASAAAEIADAASLMSAYSARPARGVDIRI